MLLLKLITQFMVWTAVVYFMHRVVHLYPKTIGVFHLSHHRYVNKNYNDLGWHWSNLFLYNDNWSSTIDLWITEVIPLIVLCFMFNDYTLLFLYWVWASFIQERIEHLHDLNLYPFLTSGKWHMKHHSESKYNYGVFLPIWDVLLRTNYDGK